MKTLFCAAALIGLAGCTSIDRPTRDVVSSRVFTPYNQPVSAERNDAVLTVVRDNGLHGGGCSSRVSIDGKLAVQLEQGEQVTLPVAGGQHSLALSHFGACGSGKQNVPAEASGQAGSYRISAKGTSMAAAKSS
jgi:hypothetical protein